MRLRVSDQVRPGNLTGWNSARPVLRWRGSTPHPEGNLVTTEEEPRNFEIDIPEGVQMPIRAGEDFASLAAKLNGMTDSRELLKVKQDAVGVPMILTSFTFRPGTSPDKGKTQGDYVSVEATTYDNRRLVFNDSSTGIRRQVVLWLIHQGVVTLGKDQTPDTAYQYWNSDKVKGEFFGKLGKENLRFTAIGTGEPIRFLARHGLRASTYVIAEDQGGNGKDTATTYYLD